MIIGILVVSIIYVGNIKEEKEKEDKLKIEVSEVREIGESISNIFNGKGISKEIQGWQLEELKKIEKSLKDLDETKIEIIKEGTPEREGLQETEDPDAAEEEYARISGETVSEEEQIKLENSKGVIDKGTKLEIAIKDLDFEYGTAEIIWENLAYVIYDNEIPLSYQKVIESDDYNYSIRNIEKIGENKFKIKMLSKGKRKLKEIRVDKEEEKIEWENLSWW